MAGRRTSCRPTRAEEKKRQTCALRRGDRRGTPDSAPLGLAQPALHPEPAHDGTARRRRLPLARRYLRHGSAASARHRRRAASWRCRSRWRSTTCRFMSATAASRRRIRGFRAHRRELAGNRQQTGRARSDRARACLRPALRPGGISGRDRRRRRAIPGRGSPTTITLPRFAGGLAARTIRLRFPGTGAVGLPFRTPVEDGGGLRPRRAASDQLVRTGMAQLAPDAR